jgi:Flp pilus assembly protein TadB
LLFFGRERGRKMLEEMIEKIKGFSEKASLVIGLSLIIGNMLLIFLLSFIVPINMWVAMIEGIIVTVIAILFLFNFLEKRRLRMEEDK